MDEAEIVEELTRFGLDERSAHVFYHLSRLGPSTASEIAQATDVQRTEVYRVMEDLEGHGFVDKTLERPRRYIPHPIEEALEEKVKQRERHLEQLEASSSTLADAWPQADHGEQAHQQRFSVHQGRDQIHGVLERMLENATDEVLMIALHRGLGRLDTMGVVEDLIEHASEGVNVRVLTEIDDERSEVLDRLSDAAEIRHLNLPGYAQLVVVDRDQIALFVSLDPVVSTQGAGETVLWLNARDFILAQTALFDTLWTTGIDYEAILEEGETGALADQLEVVRGRWMRYERIKEMLHRADDTVRLAVPAADVERFPRAGLGQALERAADRGVEVTVACPGDPDLAGVRRIPRSEPRLALLVVDDEETLIGMGIEEDPSSAMSEDEWAVWGTLPAMVEQVTALLEGPGHPPPLRGHGMV